MKIRLQECGLNMQKNFYLNKNTLKYFDFLFVFAYFCDFCLLMLPTVFSSRKIALVYFIIRFLFNDRKIKIHKDHDWARYLIENIYIFIYTIILTIILGAIADKYSLFPQLFYYILYGIIFPYIFIGLFSDEYHFSYMVIFSSLVQAVFVFFEFFNSNFKYWLIKFILQPGNISYLYKYRATGLGLEGSALSMFLWLGVFCCCYLLVNRRLCVSKSIFLSSIIVILVGAMFISGRTGLYLSFIFLPFITFMIFFLKNNALKKFFIPVLFVGLIVGGVSFRNIDLPKIETLLSIWNRVSGIIYDYENDATLKGLTRQHIPEFGFYTIVGTGLIRGRVESFYAMCDRGYVKTYMGLGLIVGIYFYFCFFKYGSKLILNIKDKKKKLLLLCCFCVLFVVEYKEAYFYEKYIFSAFFIVFSSLINKLKDYQSEQYSN